MAVTIHPVPRGDSRGRWDREGRHRAASQLTSAFVCVWVCLLRHDLIMGPICLASRHACTSGPHVPGSGAHTLPGAAPRPLPELPSLCMALASLGRLWDGRGRSGTSYRGS